MNVTLILFAKKYDLIATSHSLQKYCKTWSFKDLKSSTKLK
jgi:hypothetical protein